MEISETSGLSVLRRSWRRVLAQVKHLPRALRLLTEATGSISKWWLILLVMGGVLPAATVFWVRQSVDALTLAGRSGLWTPVLLPVAALAVVLLLTEALGAWQRLLTGLQAERTADYLAETIQAQALAVDLERYDDPGFYDRLHRARYQAAQHPSALLDSGGSLLQNSLTLIAMAGLLLPYGWWLPCILVLSTLPAVVGALAIQLEDYHWRRRTTPDRRRAWYFDQLMAQRESAAELRVLNLGPSLRGSFRRLRQGLRRQREKLAGRRLVFESLASLLALGAAGGVLVFMATRYLEGTATLGDLALFAQAFYQGQKLMRSLLENVGNLYGHLFDIGDLFAFLDLPVEQSEAKPELEPGPTLRHEIALHGVSYRYPAADAAAPLALDGLEMSFKAGLIHAVIGANGAGKSTLVKLLCGLLEPAAGCIEIDGKKMTGFSRQQIWSALAVMFQEPVRYQATARDNVKFGDLASAPLDEDLERAAADAGFREVVDAFDHGWDTFLGTWFEQGRELSVGQWQRLALARAGLRQAPLLLLDEPTSAMDVWSEASWFERLRQVAAGRTVILITHRLTAARHADRIHLLDRGKVLEAGSHDELVAAGGRYAGSWGQAGMS